MFRMVFAVIRTPVHTALTSHLKVTAYLRSMFVVPALSTVRIVPDAGSIELSIGRGLVTGYVSEQVFLEQLGKLGPGRFGRLALAVAIRRGTDDVTRIAHVKAADAAVTAIRKGRKIRDVTDSQRGRHGTQSWICCEDGFGRRNLDTVIACGRGSTAIQCSKSVPEVMRIISVSVAPNKFSVAQKVTSLCLVLHATFKGHDRHGRGRL